MNDADDEFSADLFGEGTEQTSLRYVSKPWHKARKQFVRQTQWAALIDNLLESASRERFTYLTLPGSDLLDVRYLHDQVLAPRRVRMRFLGFDTSASPVAPEQAVFEGRLHATLGLQFLDQGSIVRSEDFRRVGQFTSPAFKQMVQEGPYDAINIDLCGGIVASADVPTFLHAVESVLRVQSRTTSSSLIFVTTRTDDQQIDQNEYSQLQRAFYAALGESAEFAAAIDREFGSLENLVSQAQDSETKDIRFIAVFASWLATSAARVDLQVELKSVQSYKVDNSNVSDDMAAMAFLLTPVRTTRGLVPDERTHSENSLANTSWKRLPSRLAARKRVDQLLAADGDLEHALREATLKLLTSSGYELAMRDLP